MNDSEWLAARFEDHRPRLRSVAYRMLGSLSEADDAVQEAWLRLNRVDADEVENLGGWLTTVVARVSLNMLRSRRSRREEPFDEYMPEPIVDPADGTDPEHEALLADSVGLALLVVLERLSPAERLAFVLHDMFAVCPSTRSRRSSIARRRRRASSPAAPGAASRARTGSPTPTSTPSATCSTSSSRPRARATSRRCSRCSTRTWSSGATAPPSPSAARGSSAGPRTWLAASAVSRLDVDVRPALVNGAVGTVTLRDGRPFAIAGFTIRDGRIVEMDIVADPESLRRVDLAILSERS